MPTLKTVAALLAIGTFASLMIAIPSSDADQLAGVTDAVLAQIAGEAENDVAENEVETERETKTEFIDKVVPRTPTSDLALRIESMMDDERELKIDGSLGNLSGILQEQLGIPVFIDARGIKFANQTDESKVVHTATSDPLRTSLRKLLSPLGLKAVIEDEGLVVTADPDILVHRGIGVSRWINVNDQRVKIMADALQKEIDVDFVDTPLEEAMAEISRLIKIRIRIDRRALEEIGLTADTPVKVSLKQLPARNVLQVLLSDLDLTYTVASNQLGITTIEAAEWRLLNRFYWLEGVGLAGDFDSMIQLIQISIFPDTWEALGGPSTISPHPGKRPALMVSATYVVHEQIESMLNSLRENTFGPELTIERVEVPVKNKPADGDIGGGGFGGGGFGGGGLGGGGFGGGGAF